jgi:outer membrane lipoprotein-sorting protein
MNAMRTLLITLGFLTLAALPALAAAPAAAPDTRPEVQAVENYFNTLATLKARFIQTGGNQQVAGDFYLKRPGRMRFEYDAPIKDFIVADGLFIYYYDGKLKEQKNAPISQSLADFFLRKNLKLSGDVKVTHIQRSKGLLQVTVVQAKDPKAGSITFGLTEKPMMLKKWRIVDGTGAITEVELFETVTGIKLDSSLFHYYDPEKKKPSYN